MWRPTLAFIHRTMVWVYCILWMEELIHHFECQWLNWLVCESMVNTLLLDFCGEYSVFFTTWW